MGIIHKYHIQTEPESGIEGHVLAVEVGEAQVGHQRDVDFAAVVGHLVRETVAPSVVQTGNRGEAAHPKPLDGAVVVVEGKCRHNAGYGVIADRMSPISRRIGERESAENVVEEVVKTDAAAVRGQYWVADVELELVARQPRLPSGFRHAALLVAVEGVDVGRLYVEIGVPGEKRPFALHVAAGILVPILAVHHMLEPHIRPDGTPDQVAVGQAVVEPDIRDQRGEQRLHCSFLVGGHPHSSIGHQQLVPDREFRPDVGHDGEIVVERIVELEFQREEDVVHHRVMVELVMEPKVRVVIVGTGSFIEVGLEVEDAERPESQSQGDPEMAEMVGEFDAVLASEAGLALHVRVWCGEGCGQHQLRLRGQPDAEAVVPNRNLHGLRTVDAAGILSADRPDRQHGQEQKQDNVSF